VSDLDLVSRARTGDTAAFGELVERHRTAVFRAALAVLGSPEDAEDVAQEACVLAFRKLGGFREEASFRTWLLAIAWRHALTRRRRLAGWLQSLRGLPGTGDRSGVAWEVPADDPAAPGEDAEQAVLRRERASAVGAGIRALPPKLRHCLLLAGSGDYSYEEIGAMVGAPVGTVKWRVSEARRQVKARLAREGWATHA
jgi:RNA polymerase sigma-70 factor (ECF subfamily)